MSIKIKFLGATKNVTGSRFLLEANGKKLLIDCGMHQERELRERDWDEFVVAQNTIDAVLLTHAHLDHCGFLPRLVHYGFRNRVFCTDETMDIVKIMLMDSAKIQAMDAENKKQRHHRKGITPQHPEIPLYTTADVEACFPLFTTVKYGQKLSLGDGIEAVYHNAGHVFGSAMIEINIRNGRDSLRIIFSGDIGRRNRPIIEDPTFFEQADYLVTESTYGDRDYPDEDNLLNEFTDIINTTVQAGGHLIIPSFALERAQDILYYLNKARDARLIKPINVYLDSPMAIEITKIFKQHSELYDRETREMIMLDHSPFEFPGLHYVSETEDSKKLDWLIEPSIIIAGAGMATGGRIKHHLAANISRPESTIMFAGYQAVGTLGRNIVEQPEEIRILGEYYPVRARIIQMHGFSSHADQSQLLSWNCDLKQVPRRIFVVHGEETAANTLADAIRKQKGWQVAVPNYKEEYELD
jgi:metallo-beta-lactamase family protein